MHAEQQHVYTMLREIVYVCVLHEWKTTCLFTCRPWAEKHVESLLTGKVAHDQNGVLFLLLFTLAEKILSNRVSWNRGVSGVQHASPQLAPLHHVVAARGPARLPAE